MTETSDLPDSLALLASRFVAIVQTSLRGMDQLLGYPGKDRFVALYYEPRGEEVIWKDSESSGFATGAWSVFMDDVAPVADLYNVDVGSRGLPALHVLLIDRARKVSYFADKNAAFRFLAGVAENRRSGHPQGEAHFSPTDSCVEITHASICKLAHELWETKGRPQGQALQDWLEAEAKLRPGARKN